MVKNIVILDIVKNEVKRLKKINKKRRSNFMENKNQKVKEHLLLTATKLNEKYTGIISDEKIDRAIMMFQNSELEYEEII